MNKKSCVALLCFFCILASFSACAKRSPYGKVIVDSRGMEHIIMTDANGVTVCDKFGELVEVVTDSANKKPVTAPIESGTFAEGQSGEYQTQSITFPDVVENGDVLEEKYYKVTVPDGWENVGTGRIILRHKATGAQVSVYPDMTGSVESKLEQMENDRAALSVDMEYNEYETTVCGFKAVCCDHKIGEIHRLTYVFMTDRNMLTEIACTVKLENENAVDFQAVLSAIQFK